MAWDKNKPSGQVKLRLFDDQIRENEAALEAALSEGHDFSTGGGQTGKHTAPTFMDMGSDPSAPSGTDVRLYNKGGKLYALGSSGEIGAIDGFPSGTKMIFYQDSAPPGWTIDTTLDDAVVYVTKGSAAGGNQGGAEYPGGSWTISGVTVTVAGHALTIDEMPAHSHNYYTTYGHDTSKSSGGGHAADDVWDLKATSTVGGGQAHSHGASFSHDGSWRPKGVCAIIATKD